jgi:hypothetical protein
MALVASWEVDFVKIDDLSRPYHQKEIEAIRKAIDKTGRPIMLSTSPGATPVNQGAHVMKHANQWRISDDFWDNWPALYDQFKRLHDWTPFRGPGHFPDADILPLGKIQGGSPSASGRATDFTANEQYTLMSLWAIARSPLIHGGDMTQMDSFTLSLLTNVEVIAVNQFSTHNRQLFRTNDLIAWVSDDANSTNKYLALFNATGSSASVPVNLASIGYTNSCSIRRLWDGVELGSFTGTFTPTLASHRGQLYRLSGPTIPIAWLTDAIAGSNQVRLAWENISTASSYRVKRTTSETGSYATIADHVTGTNYTDLTAQNGTTYYYAVSRPLWRAGIAGLRPARGHAVGPARHCQLELRSERHRCEWRAGRIVPATNWNNSWPDNPVSQLRDHTGVPTAVEINYTSFNTWSIQGSDPRRGRRWH